jgi:hypothetical protein
MPRPIRVIAFAVLAIAAWESHANAAPPTVTPSPGYDARLQEQRAQGRTMLQPTATGSGSGAVVGCHVKRTHHLTK